MKRHHLPIAHGRGPEHDSPLTTHHSLWAATHHPLGLHGILAVGLGLAALTGGCGSGGSAGEPPRITVARVDPPTLGSLGGQAKVRAQVEGGVGGITWVRATVVQPDGAQVELALYRTAEGYHEAPFQAPSNPGSHDEVYTVTVSAGDAQGNVTQPASAGTLTVYADTAPPPPPII